MTVYISLPRIELWRVIVQSVFQANIDGLPRKDVHKKLRRR